MKPLLYSVLIVFCLISCKGKEGKELPEIDVLGNRWRGSNDSSNTYKGLGAGYLPIDSTGNPQWMKHSGTIYKPAQGIVITNAGKPKDKILPSIVIPSHEHNPIKQDADGLFNIIVDTSGYLMEFTTFDFIIADSIGTVAQRINGKWEIIDCERAMEAVYIIDSTRNADFNIERKLKKTNNKQ